LQVWGLCFAQFPIALHWQSFSSRQATLPSSSIVIGWNRTQISLALSGILSSEPS
jgi:hypothetical protein